MELEFDPAKDQRNVAERGISFALAADFDFDTALIARDDRRDYGEPRFMALGFIGDRLHVLVFTMRGQTLRVISLRRANERECARYAEAQP